jgi:hypothetical protein
MPVEIGKVIEKAGNIVELWMLLETHSDEQANLIDDLLSQLLRTEQVDSEEQILSYYDRVLKAIRQVEGLGRIQDLLTHNQVEVLPMVLPKREDNN